MCIFKRKDNNILASYNPYALKSTTYNKNGAMEIEFEPSIKRKKHKKLFSFFRKFFSW